MTDLARKLVSAPWWEWKPGMVMTDELPSPGDVITIANDREIETSLSGGWTREDFATFDVVPDINHPATKGWMLEMLRESTGDTSAFCTLISHWEFLSDRYAGPEMPTEGEALAAALLAVRGES